MTLDQIKLFKDSYMQAAETPDHSRETTLGEYMRFCLDGGVDFVTSKDLVVFDDEHTLLHCVCINEDMRSQANFPVKIISSDYAIVQQLETVMSQENFEKFLEDGFMNGLISDEKKSFMIKWTRFIKNQALQPSKADPYYPSNPKVIPMPAKAIKREEEKATTSIKSVANVEAFKTALESAKDGDVFLLSNDMVIDEALTIDKSVVLMSNGARVEAPITFTTDSAMMKGFVIDVNDPDAGDGKGKALVKFTGDNFVFSSNTVIAESNAYNALNIAAHEATIEDSVFYSNQVVYNVLEFSQKEDYKVSKLTVSGNTFKASSKNNILSLFQFQDNAVVKFSNNHIEYSANTIRLSNYTSAQNVQIICVDNQYDATCDKESPEWAGFLLLQGIPKYNDDFSTMRIIFKNLIGPNGKHMLENGTGIDQVWYTYQANSLPMVSFS